MMGLRCSSNGQRVIAIIAALIAFTVFVGIITRRGVIPPEIVSLIRDIGLLIFAAVAYFIKRESDRRDKEVDRTSDPPKEKTM
jgi:hypothetical protein